MSSKLPSVYLARHGETEWTISGKHTGLSDIPLTPRGERAAAKVGERLRGLHFARVFTSPLQRARRTCDLAGFGVEAVVDPDLVEWNYGAYEGITTKEIHLRDPNWKLFRDGCPEGESLRDVTARADRVVARLREVDGDALVFSSGHFLRSLTARWLGLDLSAAGMLLLGTASLSILTYEHDLTEPAIKLWNSIEPVD